MSAKVGARMVVSWPFRHTVRVAWADLDAAGHVNNARYFGYMEDARVHCYFALKGEGEGAQGREARDLDIILARATCDYRSPARLHEEIVVEVRPGKVGASSFSLLYTLREKVTGKLVAEGESVLVSYDYAREAKKPIPEALRRQLLGG